MTLTLTTPASGEPVRLDEARAWLRRADPDDDALIEALIASARQDIEHRTGRALITQSWTETLDGWPAHRLSACGQAVRLARAPLIAVTEIRTRDRFGWRVWDQAEYRVEPGDPGRVIAQLPFSLPSVEVRAGGVEIDFTAGYGDTPDQAPAPLREAILHLVAASYGADRGDGGVALTSEPPVSVSRLIAPYQQVRL